MLNRLKISFFVILLSAAGVSAQTKPRKPVKKKTPAPAVKEAKIAVETPSEKVPAKKNERPADETTAAEPDGEVPVQKEPRKANQKGKSDSPQAAPTSSAAPNYFYEFSQPEFVVSEIRIEHDENGKGKISFMKKAFDETISDPIQISEAALERIKNAFTALGFLDSSENYQFEKDYSHLGNIKIKLKKDGREREAKFNWTQNENARILADEYRKIGQQFIWMFDISVSRENQPLESPRLLDALDSLVRRNEVSDAAQMVPFLKELSNDERIPLIARNHASRLVKTIEKKK